MIFTESRVYPILASKIGNAARNAQAGTGQDEDTPRPCNKTDDVIERVDVAYLFPINHHVA